MNPVRRVVTGHADDGVAKVVASDPLSPLLTKAMVSMLTECKNGRIGELLRPFGLSEI